MCPVCGYPDMEEPPEDFEICDCCGTQFAFHDDIKSHKVLRGEWIDKGSPWFSDVIPKPWRWDAFTQLARANFITMTYKNTVPQTETVLVRSTFVRNPQQDVPEMCV